MFESFFSEVVDPNPSVWRKFWQNSDDLASKALSFMKERYSA